MSTVFTDDSNHPSYHVRKGTNPNNAHNKSQRKPFLKTWFLAVRDSKQEN